MEKLTEIIFHISEKSPFTDFLLKNYQFNPDVEWFHVVYWPIGDEYRILHLRASSSNDLEIPELDFATRLKGLSELSEEEVCFLLGTYGRFPFLLSPNPKVDLETVSHEIREIILPTKGYLLFKEQGMEFYSYLKKANSGQSHRWVENWNKKKGKVRTRHLFKGSEEKEVDLFDFFPQEEMGDFFMNRPTSETYFLLNQLHEGYKDQFVVEGIFKAEYLGDLFYEEPREKEVIEGAVQLIETKNGWLRLSLFVAFPKLGIRETWEFGLNYQYNSYPWLDYIELEITELGQQEYRIQLSPFRIVFGEDYFDDFHVEVQVCDIYNFLKKYF